MKKVRCLVRVRHLLGSAMLSVALPAATLMAQQTPVVTHSRSVSSTSGVPSDATSVAIKDTTDANPFQRRTPVTRAEQIALLEAYQNRLRSQEEEASTTGLVDTTRMRAEFTRQAGVWLRQAVDPATGMQLDALGALAAEATDDATAQRAFDQRLADTTLSVTARAQTLRLAVEKFTDGRRPGRLSIAKQYAAQLDALPASAAGYKFKAHNLLSYMYYDLGDGANAAREAKIAISFIGQVPFEQRMYMVRDTEDGGNLFVTLNVLSDVSSTDTTQRHVIDSIGKVLKPLLKADPDKLKNDTRHNMYAYYSNYLSRKLKESLETAAMLGRSAPPAVATHWYNAPAPGTPSNAAPGARQLPLGNGKVFVLEFGGLGCTACLQALPRMQQLREQFASSSVEFWYMAQSNQRWGATECTPDESAEHIRKYYVVHHKATLPMGVWAPPVDDSTTLQGAVIQREHPTFKAFNIVGVPVFVVIDGKGRVRRIIHGNIKGLDRELTTSIRYLLKEES